MDPMDVARRLASEAVARGEPTGWFERLYATAERDPARIPWARLAPDAAALDWAGRAEPRGAGGRALVVGCGLGDDAEALAAMGWQVTGFDVAPSGIAWCRSRFPGSPVRYEVADVLDPPLAWRGAFALVLESNTLQALPQALRPRALAALATLPGPGGRLLVATHVRRTAQAPDGPPWPLLESELVPLEQVLRREAYEVVEDGADPLVARLRACYRAAGRAATGGSRRPAGEL